MANKKVSQLTSKPSVLTTDLFPIADPTTGQLYKTTISDLGTAIGSGVSSVNGLVGAVVLDTDDIQELVSPTNKWFTDTRARAALAASSPLTYNSGTGVFGIQVANGSQNGYLSSADWTTFNAKQAALSGTGFVKSTGGTISYDTNTYLTTSAAASTYLALAGGTMTGVLFGASASFSGYVGFGGNTSPLYQVDVTGSGRFSGDLRIESTNPRIYLTDTDNNPDYFISNTDGTFTVYDVTNSQARFTIGTTGNATFTNAITGAGSISGASLYATTTISAGNSASIGGNGGVGGVVNIYKSNSWTVAGDGYTSIYSGSGFLGVIDTTGSTDKRFYLSWSPLTTSTLRTYTLPDASGTFALTSNLSSYLPLSGGTLTGALSGTSATFSSNVIAQLGITSGIDNGSAARGFTTNYQNNASSRAWRMIGEQTQYGDFQIQQATTQGGSTFANILRFNNSGDAFFSKSVTVSYASTNGASSVIIKNTETTGSYNSAGLQLHAYDGSSVAIGTSLFQTFNGFSYQQIGGNQTNLYGMKSGGLRFATVSAPIIFANGSSDADFSVARMYINPSGSVGIGTTSPSSILHAQGISANLIVADSTSYAANVGGKITFQGNYRSIGDITDAGYIKANKDNSTNGDYGFNMVFATSQNEGSVSERMRIKSSGSVAITSSSNDTGGRRLYAYDGGGGNQNGLGLDMSGNSYEYSLFFAYGTSDNGRMTAGSYAGDGTYRPKFILYGNGNYSFSGSNVSDIRLKQDINTLELNSIDKLYALTPKSYYMKDNTDLIRYGFIAQEVKEILPDLINGVESEDSYLGIDYNGLTTLLVKAVKELKAELDTLKNK